VGPEQKLVCGILRVVLRGLHAGQPLHGEGRPFQGVGHDQVIKKGGVLLPDSGEGRREEGRGREGETLWR
jgi:hypothetical protein